GRAVVAAVEVDAEIGVDIPAETDDALIGELGAAERAVAIDESNAHARADIRRDHRTGREVIHHVRQDTELADLVADRTAGEGNVVLVVAIDTFEFDARADEVVADHATGGEARLRIHALAEDRGVEKPVQAAFGTDVEARLRNLRLGHDRQRHQSNG